MGDPRSFLIEVPDPGTLHFPGRLINIKSALWLSVLGTDGNIRVVGEARSGIGVGPGTQWWLCPSLTLRNFPDLPKQLISYETERTQSLRVVVVMTGEEVHPLPAEFLALRLS